MNDNIYDLLLGLPVLASCMTLSLAIMFAYIGGFSSKPSIKHKFYSLSAKTLLISGLIMLLTTIGLELVFQGVLPI